MSAVSTDCANLYAAKLDSQDPVIGFEEASQQIKDGPKGLNCSLNKSKVPRLFASTGNKSLKVSRPRLDVNMTSVIEVGEQALRCNSNPIGSEAADIQALEIEVCNLVNLEPEKPNNQTTF